MSDIRQDPTTGRWVIIAPERGRRPNSEGWKFPVAWNTGPDFDPSCPFCPGNEQLLPSIINEMPCEAAPGWLTRVVPNKYPALGSANDPPPKLGEVADILPGRGFHEVIVETSHHNADLTEICEFRLGAVISTYQKRYVELISRPAIKAVMIFRNHGARAGASLPHPHSQLIATSVVPPLLTEIASWAGAHFQEHQKCVTCELITREIGDGKRVVEVTEQFVALVPFAAASPFELWILPRCHQASFAVATDDEIHQFGSLLRRALRRIEKAVGNPPYTYAIQSAPLSHTDAPYFHWRLRIVPNVVTPGGFELGGGLPINPSSPEGDAEALRSVKLAS